MMHTCVKDKEFSAAMYKDNSFEYFIANSVVLWLSLAGISSLSSADAMRNEALNFTKSTPPFWITQHGSAVYVGLLVVVCLP